MKGYILSPAATADLDAIWDYTADNWSIERADRYVGSIKLACIELGNGTSRGRSIDHAKAGYQKRSVGAHFIVFRIVGEVVDVIRILHQRMDIPQHIAPPGNDN